MIGIWQLESSRLFFLVSAILLIGLFTGQWAIAIGIPCLIYIVWSMMQLRKLLKWFSSGARPSAAPECGGAWGELVHYYNRQRKQQQKRKSRLRNMLTRFNDTVSALPDGTVILNRRLEIEWANLPARDILRIDTERDLGLSILNLIRTQDFANFLQSDDDKRRMEMKSPHDPSVTLLMQMVPFGKGQKLLLARDISERIEAQRSRKSFVDNASHELKSPLTVIMGYLETVEMSPKLDDALRPAVGAALEQSQQMNQIIQDLLVLSSLESDVPVPENVALYDVADLIRDVVTKAEDSGKAAHHQLELDVDDSLRMKITPTGISSIVTNLIHNAIVHTPHDTKVNILWQRKGNGDACFRVSDDGPGVPVEHLSHLTERFYRVDRGRNRSAGSTGLGLSIVKHSAERFGGELSIRHGDEVGMVFEVLFRGRAVS